MTPMDVVGALVLGLATAICCVELGLTWALWSFEAAQDAERERPSSLPAFREPEPDRFAVDLGRFQ